MENSSLVSIVIPSRNEEYLNQTVKDLLEKAQGDIEIIVTLDGYWPNPSLIKDDRIKLIHKSKWTP